MQRLSQIHFNNIKSFHYVNAAHRYDIMPTRQHDATLPNTLECYANLLWGRAGVLT